MSNHHQNLSRGHALLSGTLGAIFQRWVGYVRLALVTAAIGAVVGPFLLMSTAELKGCGTFYRAHIAAARFWEAQPTFKVSTAQGPQEHHAKWYILHPAYQALEEKAVESAKFGAICGLLFGLLACEAWRQFALRLGQTASADRSLRGSGIISERVLRRRLARNTGREALKIASVPFPEDLETRHLALIGSTGSGKSTVLRQMLDGIEARGDAAVIYDTSGEFIAHYYRPERGDIILNPFDERGAYWSPFDEIEHPADADRLAAQLVASTGGGEHDIWLEAARTLVANILRRMWSDDQGDLSTLIDTLQTMPKEEMGLLLSGTSSARTFEQGAEKATSSVLFMLARCANLLQFLRATPGSAKTFSFQHYFRKLDATHGAKPWIFVPRKEQYFDATRPLLACFLECAATAIMGLSPSSSRRVWLILDELADLPKVDNLSRLLPQGRKFGASVVLTFQAIGQMRERYGQDGAEALLANANTKLFLHLVDPATRQWACQSVGEHEVEIRSASENLDYQTGKGRTSLGASRQVQSVLVESQFRLPRHQGVLQLPDGYPAAWVALRDDHIRQRGAPRHPGYVPLDMSQTLWGRSPPAPVEVATTLEQGPV